MNYKVFLEKASRQDAEANDKTHFFSRLFALPVAYICYRAKFSPNFITFLFLFFGVLSSVSLYYELAILGYIFWRVHIVLDMADGSVARATKNFSQHAEGFDRSNHIIINTSILVAITSSSGSLLLVNALIISFFLQYNFSRNFVRNANKTVNLSFWASVIRHILGIEGLIFLHCLNAYVGYDESGFYTACVYVVTFSLLFFVKLYRRLINGN